MNRRGRRAGRARRLATYRSRFREFIGARSLLQIRASLLRTPRRRMAPCAAARQHRIRFHDRRNPVGSKPGDARGRRPRAGWHPPSRPPVCVKRGIDIVRSSDATQIGPFRKELCLPLRKLEVPTTAPCPAFHRSVFCRAPDKTHRAGPRAQAATAISMPSGRRPAKSFIRMHGHDRWSSIAAPPRFPCVNKSLLPPSSMKRFSFCSGFQSPVVRMGTTAIPVSGSISGWAASSFLA